MSASDSQPESNAPSKSSAEALHLPRDTTPTWEIELLLSGALIVSMLQLPPLLDDSFYSLRPRLDGTLFQVVWMFYFYAKMVCYTLIATFGIHLFMRAIWVAAIGLRSVYPDGIDWDKLKRGPIFCEVAKTQTASLKGVIDRFDNLASMVFATGMLVVLMSIAVSGATFLTLMISGAIEIFGQDTDHFGWLALVCIVLLVAPIIIASLIDRRYGDRIAPDSRLGRSIRAIYVFSGWFMLARLTNPFMLTFMSRLGATRGNLLVVGVLYSVMAVILVETFLRHDLVSMPGESMLPRDPTSRELRAVFYSDKRSEDEAREGRPVIPTMQPRGAYLPLFIPYVAKRIEPALRKECPTALPQAQEEDAKASEVAALEEQRVARLLDCIASLHPIRLNGELRQYTFDIATDPTTGLRGFQAMVPLRELAPGRHELRVARPQEEDEEEALPDWIIPFWK